MNTHISSIKSTTTTIRYRLAILKAENAAIDLASIMVGVAVMAVLAGVIAATVFLVIPWAQDGAAKNQLQSVQLAQQTFSGYRAASGEVGTEFGNSYGTASQLQEKKLLASDSIDALCISVSPDGSDYLALIKSGSGAFFEARGSAPQPVPSALTSCGDEGPPVDPGAGTDYALPAALDCAINPNVTWTPEEAIADPVAAKVGKGITALTLADACAVTEVVPTGPVTSVEGIQAMKNLESLDLWGTELTDLRPVGSLTKLKALYLTNTGIADLTPVANLKDLETLVVAGASPVTSVAPLSALPKLTMLTLTDTQVTDLRALTSLPALESLTISNEAGYEFSHAELREAGYLGVDQVLAKGVAINGAYGE